MEPLRLNTGAVIVPVLDEYGEEIAKIKFNPTDLNILDRLDAAKIKINKVADIIAGDNDDDVDTLRKATNVVIEAVNDIVNADIGHPLFAINSPFSPLENGKLFCEEVIDSLGDMINKVFGNRFEEFGKSRERMANELSEYVDASVNQVN